MRSNKHHNSIPTYQHINPIIASVYLLIMIVGVTISNFIMDNTLNSLDPEIDDYGVTIPRPWSVQLATLEELLIWTFGKFF